MTMRRRTAGLSVLLTITLGFVAVGARATPAGAPSTSTLGTGTPMVQTSNAAGWVGPPFLPRIQDIQIAQGMVFDPVEQTVARQKLTFRMPAVTAMDYVGVCLLSRGNLTQSGRFGRASRVQGCPAAQEYVDDALAAIPSDALRGGVLGIGAQAWFQSPPGSQRPFGLLPPVRVNSVAFGSIPLTAIVHISQPLRDGTIQPFQLRWFLTFGYVPADVVIPGYGPAPGYPYGFERTPIFGGPVEIRLSDVEVDGVPVPVGNDCAAAAEVNFHPRGGYYSIAVPPQKGEPGEFGPLAAISYLPGTVDIAPFSNCRDGGEDLAPLLTNMISGPGNHIDMTMKANLTDWCTIPRSPSTYPDKVGDVYCDLNEAPPVGQTMTAQRAKSTASSAQSLPASFLDELPATVRKQLAGFMMPMTPPPTSAAKR